MSDYRVDIKVRNNVFLSRLEKAGYKTVSELCKLNGKPNYQMPIGAIINMTLSPFQADGEWRKCILFCSEHLDCAPEDLFTESQLNTVLETNKRSVQVKEAEMKFMLENSQEETLSLDYEIYEDQRKEMIESQLNLLVPREEDVIKMRFGLGEYDREYTLDEIAKKHNRTTERIRQIEAKALRKMRHPRISDNLKIIDGDLD